MSANMTCRLLPLLLISLLAIVIGSSSSARLSDNATKQQLWKRSNNNNNSNDVTKVVEAEARSNSRQHKAFFVNYPVMQRVYKDKHDLDVSESRKRHKQRLRKPNKKPESEIFFIKLPPSPYSYVEGLGYISQPPVFNPASLPQPQAKPKPKPKPFVKVPIDFVSNGKPTKVYHYPPYKVDTPVIRLNHGPYNFNGNPTGIYVIKKKKKPKRKPVVRNETYKKKVVLKQ